MLDLRRPVCSHAVVYRVNQQKSGFCKSGKLLSVAHPQSKALAKWQTAIPTYAKVKYTDVYPGIDLVYYGNRDKREYDFVVAPGADVSQMRLAFDLAAYDGTRPLMIDPVL